MSLQVVPNSFHCFTCHQTGAQHACGGSVRPCGSSCPPRRQDAPDQPMAQLQALLRRLICPHGDRLCPCKDGLLCHYEGTRPMTPPYSLGSRYRCRCLGRCSTHPGCR